MQMMKVAAGVALVAVTAGCGRLGSTVQDSQQSYLFDGVKLIRSDITRPNDPRSLAQARYMLGTEARLLLRFESLSQEQADVRTDDDRPVEVLITPEGDTVTRAAAAQSLQLCALMRNWTMLSTGYRAHSFDSPGNWSGGGPDYDAGECLTASGTEGSALVFNVRQ